MHTLSHAFTRAAAALLVLTATASAQQILQVGRLDANTPRATGARAGTASGPGLTINTGGPFGIGSDADNDGLDSSVESEGWDIVIDEHGYGTAAVGSLLTIRHVTSDPNMSDTDGDGLTDDVEWLMGSDPRSADTDGDGLDDEVEWNTWFTSPNSVDSDGDARGPDHDLPPSASLFDGLELDPSSPRTSPTLDDTDGDGRTDFEELGHPVFSPVLAELPRAVIEVVGELDIRLDVEYAESEEVTTSYEVSFTEATSQATSIEESSSWGSSSGWSWDNATTLGFTGGVQSTPPNKTKEVHFEDTFTYGSTGETFSEDVITTSTETAISAEQTHSQYLSDTQTFTETVSTGSVTVPIRVRNASDFSFSLTELGITLTHFTLPETVGGEPVYKAMGTALPAFETITLSPGESTPIMTLDAGEVNADVVKAFLAKPDSLLLQPSQFNLVDQEGIDFDFLTETTFSQTALVEIDYGGGDVQTWRVATNVDRDGFEYLGISVPDVLTDILGIAYETEVLKDASDDSPIQGLDADGQAADINVLTSLGGQGYVLDGSTPTAFWGVIIEGDLDAATKTSDGSAIDFLTTRLYGGSTIRMIYTRDQDQDGLWEAQEIMAGTSDLDANSDGDTLTDYEEVVEGWEFPAGSGKIVRSDPRVDDTDGDGLKDGAERTQNLDPTNPDSDGDGLLDGDDPYPLIPAARMFAVPSGDASVGGDALSWTTARTLADALLAAASANSDGSSDNDVGSIWVSRGAHEADGTALVVPAGVQLFGGFEIGDGKLGNRDPDALTNETVIVSSSGDPGAVGGDEPMVYFEAGSQDDPAGTLDGFTVQGAGPAAKAAIQVRTGTATLRNLLLAFNTPDVSTLRMNVNGRVAAENCLFLANTVTGDGAAVYDGGNASSTFEDCEFSLNRSGQRGGAYMRAQAGSFAAPIFRRCTFVSNQVHLTTSISDANRGGGAVWTQDGGRFEACDFFGNRTSSELPASHTSGGFLALFGGAISYDRMIGTPVGGLDCSLELVNCRLYGNVSGTGGALFARDSDGQTRRRGLNVVNSTFAYNIALRYIGEGDPTEEPSGGIHLADTVDGFIGEVLIQNSVFWENANDGQFDPSVQLPNEKEQANISLEGGYTGSVLATFNTVQGMWQGSGDFVGWGNTGADPLFASPLGGNLRLSTGSSAIDAGINAVDTDMTVVGFQPLPTVDLDGGARVLDGDGLGGAQVDRGAYEYQP